MGPIPFHLIGFSSEDAAKSAVSLVDKVIFDTSQQLGLNIESLDGVTIAYDYRAALAASIAVSNLTIPSRRPVTR